MELTTILKAVLITIIALLNISCEKEEKTVSTETITDIEGNVYNIVIIGSQTWLMENLKTTKYNDGSDIPELKNQVESFSTPGYRWYNNDRTYKNTYGALYSWYTVETGKLCPIGWHIPNNEEWTELIDYLGGPDFAGGKLKETGISHWVTPNLGATNESGFTALPAGHFFTGLPLGLGGNGGWWSMTEYSSTMAWGWDLYYDTSKIYNHTHSKNDLMFSVRCIKD